jgi:hypothetical protein
LCRDQIKIINRSIKEEDDSIHVVSTCFQLFELPNDSSFVFWRTDPLFLSQKMNFDLVLVSTRSRTVCLIECKSNIIKKVESKVSRFQKKVDFVEKNMWANLGKSRLRIKDYFEQVLCVENPRFYYVLASELVDFGTSFDHLLQLSEHPFDIWRCQIVRNGIRIQRIPVRSKIKEKNISMANLTAYLDKTHLHKDNAIQICLSSSKYYLAVQSCKKLQNLDSFMFDDFRESFSIDLKGYEEFEKRFLFNLFVTYGEECNFVKVFKDTGDVFTSLYTIVNRKMNFTQLKKNIISKMANQKIKTDRDIIKKIEDEKRIIIEYLHERELRRKNQTKITDFGE